MNDSEKRRQKLLEQTRRLYSDKRDAPAVHPRYGAVYRSLYGDEEEHYETGTLGLRLFLCLLLFAAFVTMDRQGYEMFHLDSSRLVQEIETDLDVAEVWNNL